MPNTYVRAAAEGLPAINRRSLLRGIPAAGAVALATTLPAVVEAAAAEPMTSPVVSLQMQAAIDAHVTAHITLCKTCDETDEVALKRQPTKAALRRHDRADKAERKALLDLCAYPALSAGDRRAKAQYLIAFEARNQLFAEHALAILRSTMGGASWA
jgi:hypothetical protein